MDGMNRAEYHRMAELEYASQHGAQDTERAWICTPFDVWERNPHYTGPAQPHPESDEAMYDDRIPEGVADTMERVLHELKRS